MEKKRWMRILLISLAVMILVGAALTTYFLLSMANRRVIKLKMDGVEDGAVAFKHLGLAPGEEIDYTVRIYSVEEDRPCTLLLDFVETEDLSLKQYAYVRMEADGEVLCDALLADMFLAPSIPLDCVLKEKESVDISVTYYMLPEVGDEAQGAEACFDLLIRTSEELEDLA